MKIQKVSFKWISSVFVVLIVAVAVMTACSSDQEGLLSSDVENPIQPQGLATMGEGSVSDYESLLASLEAYSDDFLSSHDVPSNGNRKWGWHRFWDSVGADFVALRELTLIGSIGQSRDYWEHRPLVDVEKSVTLNPSHRRSVKNKVDSLMDVYSQDELNWGVLHNAVILNTLLENTFNFKSTEECVLSTISSCKSLGIVLSATDVDEYIRSIDTFFEEIYDENASVMYDRLTARQPSKASYYDVLEKYLNTVQNFSSIKDIKDYTTGYTQLIQRSDITIAEANDLLRNISIAPASYELWSDIENLVTK